MLRDGINGAVRRVPVWGLYIICALPAPWLFWRALTGGLGPEPIKALEQALGLWALQFLIAVLCVTPLRRFTGINLLRFRRALGLMVAYYAMAHLLVWLVIDVQVLALIWADIVKRPYITVGMAAFVLMLPLAASSNNWALRKMGAPRWRWLHRATYGVAILGALHFVMLRKGLQLEPLLYMAAILGLLGLRLPGLTAIWPKRSASAAPLRLKSR
jgi:methionine sulfoxide reductase heme-binding subunit